MWIFFKTDREDAHEKVTEGITYSQEKVPNHACRSQFKNVESTLKILSKNDIFKHSANAKCLMSVFNEKLNV